VHKLKEKRIIYFVQFTTTLGLFVNHCRPNKPRIRLIVPRAEETIQSVSKIFQTKNSAYKSDCGKAYIYAQENQNRFYINYKTYFLPESKFKSGRIVFLLLKAKLIDIPPPQIHLFTV